MYFLTMKSCIESREILKFCIEFWFLWQVVRTLGVPNQIAARIFSFVHISQYKALQSAYKQGIAHPEIAAAYAAHYVLSE